MSNLLEISMPIVHLISDFCQDKSANYLNFSEEIQKVFKDFISNAQQLDLTYQDAYYALAAWVDEVAMFTEWDGRISWMAQPLQIQFFSEHLAGEGFFKRLNCLRAAPHNNIDSIEIFYLCLQLGFQGIYRLQNPEILQGITHSVYQQLILVRGNEEWVLANQWIQPGTKIYRSWSNKQLFIGIILLVLFSYIGLKCWLFAYCQTLLNPLLQGIA